MQSKGILDKYSKGSTGTTVRVTSKDEFICFNLWYAVCDGLVEKETMSYIRIIMEPVFVKELQGNSSLDMHSVSGSHQNMPVEVQPGGSADTRNSTFVNFGETFDETTIAELNKDKLLTTLRPVFHLREFKQGQREVIESVMSGSHTIAIMPTGSGKSLCFQLPAFLFHGVTVAIFPLLDLILDMYSRCTLMGLNTLVINQFTTKNDLTQALHDLNSDKPATKLLLITPDSLCQKEAILTAVKSLYAHNMLSLFVIDEIHCMDQWGHQYRPDYLKLSFVSQEFKGVPILGLTATAAPSSVCDISNLLNFGNDYRLFRYPSRRNNISYSVQFFRKKASSLKYIQNYVTVDSSGDCGIIYCLKPGDVHEVAHNLTHEAVNKPRLSITYGKGLDKAQRKESLLDWLSCKTDVLVATKAAGTGLDKNNVRYVLHFGCPDSVEEYYQQSWRAGRDGLPSEALLLTMEEDRRAHVRHISEMNHREKKPSVGYIKWYPIVKQMDVGKKFIDQYLGDELSDPCLNSCDNC